MSRARMPRARVRVVEFHVTSRSRQLPPVGSPPIENIVAKVATEDQVFAVSGCGSPDGGIVPMQRLQSKNFRWGAGGIRRASRPGRRRRTQGTGGLSRLGAAAARRAP